MANPTYRASTTNPLTGTTSMVGNKPTGTTNGDALYASVFTAGNSTNPTISAVPSGWTLLDSVASGNSRMSTYWKIAASEPASWTWTTSANVDAVVQVVAVQNPGDAVTPTDVSGIQANASSVNVAAAAVTTTRANGLMIGFFGTRSIATFTPDGSMTEVQDATSGATFNSMELAWQAIAAIGSTGTRTAVATVAGVSIGWLGVVKGPPVGGSGAIIDPFFWSL